MAQTTPSDLPNAQVPMPYPSTPFAKFIVKMPILLWRMGLGFLMGQVFMVLTTTGRKSGQPRHTVVEFHQHNGRKYVYSGWGEKSQWYKNIMADPHVTIQTADGTEKAVARLVRDDDELKTIYEFYTNNNNPYLRKVFQSLGQPDLETLLTNREKFYLFTFDPTDEFTPSPLEQDLRWVTALALPLAAFWLLRRGRRRKH